MTSSLDARSVYYWIEGDPIFGISPDGKADPDFANVSRETRREDAIFTTLSEVIPARRRLYLDAMQHDGCLSNRMRVDIEDILSSPHHSDCAAAMEAQRLRREKG